jgi:hypothetical protein
LVEKSRRPSPRLRTSAGQTSSRNNAVQFTTCCSTRECAHTDLFISFCYLGARGTSVAWVFFFWWVMQLNAQLFTKDPSASIVDQGFHNRSRESGSLVYQSVLILSVYDGSVYDNQ